MKKLIHTLLAIVIYSVFVQTAVAQDDETAMVPLPSLDDFTQGDDGWAFGIGLGVEYESAYEGSDEFGLEADPAGAVQWRSGDNILFFAGEALGWRGLRAETWLFEAIFAFDEGREESSSDDGHLNGLGEGEESMELVLQARRAFDADWRYWVDGRIVAGDTGNLGLVALGRRFGDQKDGTGHEVAIAVVFHDSEYANKDFGINSDQAAASGLVETNLSSGFRSLGFNYNYRRYLYENWQIFGEAVYEMYSSDIQDSPIARSDFEAEVGLGFIYTF